LQMLDGGRVGLAALYAAGSIGVGFLAIVLATNVVRRSQVAV
jgi:hypothetical protein